MSLITYVTRTHFADRVLEDALPDELRKFGVARVVVVTDGETEGCDALERLEDCWPAGVGLVRWPVAPGDPLPVAARSLRCAVLEAGAQAVLGLGGRISIDLARIAGAGLAVIAVPTTTASVGVGPVSSAPLKAAGRHRPSSVPPADLVLCDPTLTVWATPDLTARAGMDALTHCIEAFLGTAFNPPADGIAIEGVRRAGRWLERAVADGSDLVARRELLAAALNAGLAAEKGQGGVDAMARALEAEAGLSDRHGVLHAALLPPVLRFNAPAVAERLELLAQTLGLARVDRLPETLAELGARIGLPSGLAVLGLPHAAMVRAARRAAADPANQTNPRLATEGDYLGLMRQAQ